ncbi:MAG: hypothetical protein M1826_004408 [Phylliscum demangeonii]|nr:MAG: hypothetical protein M1826_004408 [Phylliscum demangeonii]
MVSFWGSKTGDHQHDDDDATVVLVRDNDAGEGGAQQQRSEREPTERSHLIPPSSRPPQGYNDFLDPDDPAVSPLNLWSVRALRDLSIIFLILSFLWWIVLLVSLFVTPPGLHTRGSGFSAFSYSTLAVGNILLLLLFYRSPSLAQRISCLIIAFLLVLQVILILAVPRLRREEGWVGIATVAWAAVLAVWVAITDRVVEWGKQEEEERLTHRVETRRTLTEWGSVLIKSIVLIFLIVVLVFMTGVLIIRARDASLSPPGDRFDVDGGRYKVHLFCDGDVDEDDPNRKPTVFFEAGESPVELGLAPFAADALKNGTIDRYCYWDRPGFGFSDNAPSPFSAGMAADALSEALVLAGEDGPWVLVSAGIGGIYSRIFASRHANDIKGIMLIDALQEDLLPRVGAPGRGLMIFLRGIVSPLGVDRLFDAIFRARTRADRVFGKSAYQSDRYLKAKLQENVAANSLTKNEIISARTIQNKETRLVVISSGLHVRGDKGWEEKQRDLTHLTDALLGWDVVRGAPHEVWQKAQGRRTMEKRLKQLVNV